MFNALPTLPTLPTLQGAQTTDSLGNIFDQAGNHIGVVAGSVADIGSTGTVGKPSSNQTTSTPRTPDWGALQDWSKTHPYGGQGSADTSNPIEQAKKATNAILHPVDTAESFIFTSRLIFLVIGLLLVGAGLFQFRATQTVIDTGTKVAKGGAKLAAAITA